MPIVHRARQPAETDPAPAVQASRISRAWLATLMVIALIVFIMFWAQTTMLVALVIALVAAAAGAFLLTLMFGTSWIIHSRHRAPDLPRYR